MVRYLTGDELRSLHRQLFAMESRPVPPELHQGCADGTAAQPAAGFAGQDHYPTLAEKAAAYAWFAAMKHCFEDGNKRLAAVAMIVFLGANGLVLADSVRPTMLAQKIQDVAAKRCSLAALALWIAPRMVRVS